MTNKLLQVTHQNNINNLYQCSQSNITIARMFVSRSSLAAELLTGMLLLVNWENWTPLCCYKFH